MTKGKILRNLSSHEKGESLLKLQKIFQDSAEKLPKSNFEETNQLFKNVQNEMEGLRREIVELKRKLIEDNDSILHEYLPPKKVLNTNKHGSLKTKIQKKASLKYDNISENFDILAFDTSNLKKNEKGSIKVFCRIKPLNSAADNFDINNGNKTLDTKNSMNNENKFLIPLDENKIILKREKQTARKREKLEKLYGFDKVFDKESTQDQIFNNVVGLIDEFVDGTDVCIFSYGHTGSGKTYTMDGPTPFNFQNTGIVDRSIDHVFKTTNKSKNMFRITTKFVEIYNGDIYDISTKEKKKLDIRSNGIDINIIGVNEIEFENKTKLKNLYNSIKRRKTTRSTVRNESSSRSHSVFSMELLNKVTGKTSILNLIDLAGSERITKYCSDKKHLRETKAINTSLSVLKNVFDDIINQRKRIAYRDSRLTLYLKKSLNPNTKNIMIVNISSDPNNVNETFRSLEFSEKVNQCILKKK